MAELAPLFELSPKQSEFLAAGEDEVLFGGSAGGGKTVSLTLKAMNLNNVGIIHPEYRALILRKSYEDIDTVLRFQSRYYRGTSNPQAEWKDRDKEWVWPNGARIGFGYVQTEKDLERYVGNEYAFIGIEELPDTLPFERWYQKLTARNRTDIPGLVAQTCSTCNPVGAGVGWIKSRWSISENGDPTSTRIVTPEIELGGLVIPSQEVSLRFIPALITDNTFWTGPGRDAYIARINTLPDKERNALLFGKWRIADDEDLLIHPDAVQAAALETLTPQRHKIGRRVIGIDPAHKGKDSTVLIHRRLETAFSLKRFSKLDTVQCANKIRYEIDKASDEDGQSPIVNIDYAFGTGPADILKDAGYIVNTIHFSGKPDDPEKYFNKRSEMYGLMADAISGETPYRIPNDAPLKAQLETILIERDVNGRLKLKPKEEIKKLNNGRSPDEADSLALTYATAYRATTPRVASTGARKGAYETPSM